MSALPMTVEDGHAIVRLTPDLGQADWMGVRAQLYDRCLAIGVADLVLDCEACVELPSIAFGVFIALARDLRRVGGGLRLVHVSEGIRIVLNRTRLDDIVPVHGTITEIFRRRDG